MRTLHMSAQLGVLSQSGRAGSGPLKSASLQKSALEGPRPLKIRALSAHVQLPSDTRSKLRAGRARPLGPPAENVGSRPPKQKRTQALPRPLSVRPVPVLARHRSATEVSRCFLSPPEPKHPRSAAAPWATGSPSCLAAGGGPEQEDGFQSATGGVAARRLSRGNLAQASSSTLSFARSGCFHGSDPSE